MLWRPATQEATASMPSTPHPAWPVSAGRLALWIGIVQWLSGIVIMAFRYDMLLSVLLVDTAPAAAHCFGSMLLLALL
jgi:hypothetical protein